MSSATESLLESFKKPIAALRRNEACHQCRKRKLKCDARRPCTTCLRSHAYLVNHTSRGVKPPQYPDCTFDEVYDEAETDQDDDNKKLQARINDLESLLRDMTIELEATRSTKASSGTPSEASSTSQNSHAASPDATSTQNLIVHQVQSSQANSLLPQTASFSKDGTDTQMFTDDLSWIELMRDGVFDNGPFAMTGTTDSAPANDILDTAFGIDLGVRIDKNANQVIINALRSGADPGLDDTFYGYDFAQLASQNFLGLSPLDQSTFDPQDYQVVHTGWSSHLPNPSLTRRLVQAFFAFHIHAGRLFHGPTFLASLDLHPLDDRFPSVVVLHALCAVGSMYMGDIVPTPVHTGSGFPYVIFHGKWRKLAARPDSFAEQQVRFAQEAIMQNFEAGEDLMTGLQANILLLWFFGSQGRWSELFMTSGRVLRGTLPLGLANAPPFKIPRRSNHVGPIVQETEILPAAESCTEEETRRNIFWLGYAAERQQGAIGNYPLELDDLDICQLLPVRGDQFDLGVEVPVEHRQWCNEKNVLLNHPSDSTDSFILYIKSTLLLSRVKTFNVRYKNRFLSGDPALYLLPEKVPASLDDLDPRDTPAFRDLDQLTSSFIASFPPQFRRPIQDEVVDPHLYATLITAHLATILLHDPHLDTGNPMCPSSNRALQASRAILELIYLISSTSYDVSLLDQLAIAGWFFAGRIIIRFLHAAIERNFVQFVLTFHSQVSYIYSVLAKAGERMPVAYRYKRVLYDILAQSCGEQFVDPPSGDSPSAYVAPAEAKHVDPAPTTNMLNDMCPLAAAALGIDLSES